MDTHPDIHIYGDIYAKFNGNRHADCFPILYTRTDTHAIAHPVPNVHAVTDSDGGATEYRHGERMGHGLENDTPRE